MNQDDFYAALAACLTDTWREYASCINVDDPSIFFIEDSADDAQEVCSGCCVQLECLDDAIAWGDGAHRGLSAASRVSVERHRKRYKKLFEYDLMMAGVFCEGEVQALQ